jgi:hypothetical protein
VAKLQLLSIQTVDLKVIVKKDYKEYRTLSNITVFVQLFCTSHKSVHKNHSNSLSKLFPWLSNITVLVPTFDRKQPVWCQNAIFALLS